MNHVFSLRSKFTVQTQRIEPDSFEFPTREQEEEQFHVSANERTNQFSYGGRSRQFVYQPAPLVSRERVDSS